MQWWIPDQFLKKRAALQQRMTLIKAIRAYFDAREFWEVETPILQTCPVMDAHIHGFGTDIKDQALQKIKTLYLHTSPEFAMKKLMVAGVKDLYQICHVFRNGDNTRRHSPEFTMIEWYRAHTDYRAMMEDCIGLLRYCAERLEIKEYSYKGQGCDPFVDWDILTVAQAFERYAGIKLDDCLEDNPQELYRQAKAAGVSVREGDRWDEMFFATMDALVEPKLGFGRPAILCDYPVSLASLSRKKPDNPKYAERFELYICGLELANAFSELTDVEEQRKRFHEEMVIKRELYGEDYPVDEDFIDALAYGFPEASGIALGVDRLAMVAVGADDIDDVLWCGRP